MQYLRTDCARRKGRSGNIGMLRCTDGKNTGEQDCNRVNNDIMQNAKYALPSLDYGYNDLQPFLSEEQLTIHHQKHHQAYVNGANLILDKLDKARSENTPLDVRAVAKEFSFQAAGHVLHSLFWKNLAPTDKGGGGEPAGKLSELITEQFGSFQRFKSEFTLGALSVEGSGWMALTFCPHTSRILLVQIEKHNVNIIPNHKIILVLDVFEHAYYLDYKNDRAKYIENFWNFINWSEVDNRLTMQ